MPCQARIDAPDALDHVIVRGIERRNIFKDDIDRLDFLTRLGKVLSDTHTRCFAWALIPNHFHLLLRSGNRSLAPVMRRALSWASRKTIGRMRPMCSNYSQYRGSLLSQNRCASPDPENRFLSIFFPFFKDILPNPLVLGCFV